MVERRIRGRELTVGVLNGDVQGIVEIFSPNGTYDYAAKYTSGRSQYEYPAALESTIEAQIKHFAALIYKKICLSRLCADRFSIGGRHSLLFGSEYLTRFDADESIAQECGLHGL